MKTKTLFLVLVLGLSTSPFLHADTFEVTPVSISGSIIQNSGGKINVEPITIANILRVLNITGVNASKLRYYWDGNTQSIVIAPTGTKTGGTGTPTASVLTLTSISLAMFPNPSAEANVGDESALNGTLTGSSSTFIEYFKKSSVTKTTFIVSGTVVGVQTIMKGTAVETF
jgi:hypothetical protein